MKLSAADRKLVQDVLFFDYETHAIGPRPEAYPPKPVSFAWKLNGKKGYVSFAHARGTNSHTPAAARKFQQELFSAARKVVCHNTAFDRDVSETHMDIAFKNNEGLWDDTMVLAFLDNPHGQLSLKPLAEEKLGMPPEEQNAVREWLITNKIVARSNKRWGAFICEAPVEVVAPYAIGDVDRTEQLWLYYKRLHNHEAYRREQLLLAPVLDMERCGVRVDMDRLEADVERYTHILKQEDKYLSKTLGISADDLDSDATVACALEDRKLLKSSLPLTEKGAVSVNKEALIECVRDKKLLTRMLLRNSLATCLRTFMQPWYEQGLNNEGRIYFKFNSIRSEYSVGARTGRMSSAPNLMNVPSLWEALYGVLASLKVEPPYRLPNCREYLLPDEDCVIAALDYSQQEMRLFAHFEDGDLMREYQKNPDIDAHDMVSKLAGISRKAAKTISFAELYGAGIGVIMEKMGCTNQEATGFKREYGKALPGVGEVKRSIKAAANAGEPITTIGGRDYYPETPKYIQGRLRDFIYKLLNYLIQGSAADQTKQAIIDYYYNPKRRGRIMFPVHDELVGSVPKKNPKAEAALIQHAMVNSFKKDLDVPFTVDISYGENYGQC